MNTEPISFFEIAYLIRKIREWVLTQNIEAIYGVPRGGCVPGVMLSHITGLPYLPALDSTPYTSILIIDDIADSGRTISLLKEMYPAYPIVTLYRRYNCPVHVDFYGKEINHDKWLVFPWENF
jgi:hypoxanthine phosphoribosyltransferase